MEPTLTLGDGLLAIASHWPSIFTFDFGRYLFAALTITAILAVVSPEFLDLRRVRQRTPWAKQRWHEFRHSLGTAVMFSLIGLGVYYGVERGIFRVYSQLAEYGWLHWGGSLVLIVVASRCLLLLDTSVDARTAVVPQRSRNAPCLSSADSDCAVRISLK